MKNQFKYSKAGRGDRRTQRRGGYVAILVALSWLAICGVAALAFDLSRMYTRKAEAQKAADACALVGAAVYGGATSGPNGATGESGATAAVLDYAKANGYDKDLNGATVQGAPGAAGSDDAGLYRVTLWRPEPVYFARLFFGSTMNVYATAAAEYTKNQDVPLQNYGVSNSIVTLSLFGPDAFKYNGDPYSPLYQSKDGPTNSTNAIANTDHREGGYNFNVTPQSDYATKHIDPATGKPLMVVEIFDPGSNNTGGADAKKGLRVDEERPGWGGQVLTTTKYTLTYNGVEVASKSYGPGSQGPDMAWDNTFTVDLSDSRFSSGGTFNLNVVATSGTSENGFTVRAGPPHPADMTDADWNTAYGQTVTMSGKDSLPINYTDNGNITIDLGVVPPIKKGGQVTVKKFDADVVGPGATQNTVTYYDTRVDGTVVAHSGSIPLSGAANGVWAPDDVIPLGDDYKGGHWTAQYTAGSNDTSVWQMRYTGPGNFRLVR